MCQIVRFTVQIKKINNNKLKVILSSNDLDKKNIDVDSFLSNSIESQDLFFEILDLAEEEYDFNIENNKAVVETISLDNNIFVLTITKLKQCFENTYTNPSKIYCFENIDDVFNIYSFLSKENTYVYEFNDNYYLLINDAPCNIENILSEYSMPIKNSSTLESLLIEHGKKVI